jgi:hypothetical protein
MLAGWLLMSVAPAGAQSLTPAIVGGQFRYWDFTDGNDMRDYLAYYATRSWHFQFEYWDFDRGDDQVRPEIGIHLRDRRQSVYNLMYRHEGKHERFGFGTDQIIGGGWVARAEISPLVFDDHTEVVLSAGADYYFGSWNFASATIIRDPRDDAFWTFPIRLRLANEANDWVQATYAPATEKTNGWAFDFKYKWFRGGVERNSRYDFTDVDNFITTVGVEFAIPPPR